MYLSRLTLNPLSRYVQHDLADLYELHRTILSSFPQRLPDDERILYRLERGTNPPIILVQSQTQPDWSCLDELEGYLVDKESKSYQPVFSPGQIFRFRLLANPTRKIHEKENASKRVGLYKDEQIMHWLHRKAEQSGFEVLECQFIRPDSQESHRKKLFFCAVQFDGFLRVKDSSLFLRAVINGIGSAKGFGFGLLSIA